MDLETFREKVEKAAERFSWIKRTEVITSSLTVMKLRLWLHAGFVDVRHNSRSKSTSYAYIEDGRRVFGANNWKIGWHWHPYGKVKKHKPSSPVTIDDFLKKLEEELEEKDKI